MEPLSFRAHLGTPLCRRALCVCHTRPSQTHPAETAHCFCFDDNLPNCTNPQVGSLNSKKVVILQNSWLNTQFVVLCAGAVSGNLEAILKAFFLIT